MKKNMLVFDTSNFTAPDSDGRPAVRFEEVEVGSYPADAPDNLSVHLQHCNFGEHAGSCKYGDENCPAISKEWDWFGWNLQQLKRCDDCHTMMNPIGKGIFECWKCVWENAGKKMENANARIAELEGQLKMADARNALLFKEKADAIALITELEARLKVAEKKFKDEREHSEWLQEECNKAVDEKEEANGRAATLEAALKEYADMSNWLVNRDERTPTWIWLGDDGNAIAQSALEPARQAEGERGVEG